MIGSSSTSDKYLQHQKTKLTLIKSLKPVASLKILATPKSLKKRYSYRFTRHHLCQAGQKRSLLGTPMNHWIHVKNYDHLHHSFLQGQIVHGRTL